MKVLVHFGAGAIGRGFIAPLFTASGWQVVFIDVNEQVVADLQGGSYQIEEVSRAGREMCTIEPVSALDGRDQVAVAEALANCDLASTAVGLGALRYLGAVFAEGITQRIAQRSEPLDVLLCENGIDAVQQLHAAVREAGAQPGDLDRLGLVRTSIGRMIPPPQAEKPLLVEPFAQLPVERRAFQGAPPSDVAGIVLADDFDLVQRKKLYLHNCTHACFAYAGAQRGYTDLPQCVADPDLAALVRAASEEVITSLVLAHGSTPEQQEQIQVHARAFVSELFERYANPYLGDTVARVGRDPWRKLAPGDRLVGAAQLCVQQGVTPHFLANFILSATAWNIDDADRDVERWRDMQQHGWRNLVIAAGLSEEDPLMTTLDVAAARRQAAEQIRAAGMVISSSEEAEIEIADFGLKRYEELGLAILVYCNTDRCCAKELAMLPGQICPEHLHPPVDGDPGKEETFRVRQGEVHLFVAGESDNAEAQSFAEQFIPSDKRDAFAAYQHVHLGPGDQYTLAPNTPHWFVAGQDGAVVSEFSTKSRDEADIFLDPEIQRLPDLD
jgi:mannitol-1-phosphate 5-dehydrogenase